MFIDRLKSLMSQHNTSWSEISKTLGIGKNQLKYWADHNSFPDGNTIIKLSNFFKVSSDYLLGISDNDKPANTVTLQEQTLIDIFRSVSETDRFEIIALCVNLKKKSEKEKTDAPETSAV